MLFSSMVFLWLFLPLLLGLYYVVKDKYKNVLLLIVSLVFYAWGEPKYIVLILITITINYSFGLILQKINKYKKLLLVVTVITDLGLLFYFKYYNMFVDTVNSVLSNGMLEEKNIILPIGISFYTFQAMSYVIDLYRGQIKVQKSWLKLSLYIAFFPQLIAGPIVKYKDICEQIDCRTHSMDKFVYGIKRFSYGLGKKVIISNSVAAIVDEILKLDMNYISTPLAWCVAICYSLQIYFDFSGYSDMAIGLGKMFGFEILENFNYPYISQSIQEFWRRWHMSLSTWFKEYLYIPLGGNRKGNYRTYINLFIVFLTTGLWHGASYTFVIWGLFHGFFQIIERLFLGEILKKNPLKIFNHLYAMLVVIIGWVIFRSDNIKQACYLIKKMFVFEPMSGFGIQAFIDIGDIFIVCVAIAVGIIGPLLYKNPAFTKKEKISFVEMFICIIIVAYSILLLVCNTYNPFIYFRF